MNALNIIKSYVKNNKGFTLIELLVVIAIIGTLSTIGFIALTSSQDGANDAVKISEIRSLQSAIQIKSASSGSGNKFPGAGDACAGLDTTIQSFVGETISGIDFDEGDYFYCAGGTVGNVDSEWYIVGAIKIKNATAAALNSDLDQGDVTGTGAGAPKSDAVAKVAQTIGGQSVAATKLCEDTGTATAVGAIYCLGVV